MRPILKEFFILLRFNQYIKNIFIFLPLFFSLKFSNVELLCNVIYCTIAFSITTSAVYILNDYCDIEYDQHHPKKNIDHWHLNL